MDRVAWSADYRLLHVKRCIQQHRDPRDLFELIYKVPISRIDLTIYHLRSSRTVNVYNGWNLVFVIVRHRDHRDHKGVMMLHAENLSSVLFLHRRRKGPKPLTQFYLLV